MIDRKQTTNMNASIFEWQTMDNNLVSNNVAARVESNNSRVAILKGINYY